MLDAEAKELLEAAYCAEYDILGEAVPIYRSSQKAAMKSYARSKMTSEHFCTKTQENMYPTAWERIVHYGKNCGFSCALVAEEENRLVLIGGSGVLQMNPAVVEILFTNTGIEMNAWAKEGFIKQKTARRAIQSCKEALGLAES